MFRRTLSTLPAQASRSFAVAARPALASGRTAPRAAPVNAKRQYHEKDEFRFSSSAAGSIRSGIAKDNPRNVGSMQKGESDVGTGLVGAPACGDVMKLQIRVDPNDNTISDVKFKTFGCGSAIASSSYLTELVRGMSLEQASKIRNTEIAKELSLPPVKLHCSMLAEDAIKSAISNYYTKNPNARQTDLGSSKAQVPNIEVETIKEGATA